MLQRFNIESKIQTILRKQGLTTENLTKNSPIIKDVPLSLRHGTPFIMGQSAAAFSDMSSHIPDISLMIILPNPYFTAAISARNPQTFYQAYSQNH